MHRPEVVVLYCGENDIIDGNNSKAVLASFQTFLRLLLYKSPCTKVLYVGMKPSPARWTLWPEMSKANKLVAQYIKRLNNPDIRYLDIASNMLDPQLNNKPRTDIFLEDKLHMNRSGYLIWQAAILPELEKMFPNV